MTAVDPNIIRRVVGGVGLVLLYGYSFWRIFKRNPENKLIACGGITLMVFVLAMASFKIPQFPIWIVASLFFLFFLLGILTMSFLVQQGYRALTMFEYAFCRSYFGGRYRFNLERRSQIIV